MGRPIPGAVLTTRNVPRHAWPAWVLAFPGGIPADPAAAWQRQRQHRTWRTDRDIWRRQHTDLHAAAFVLAAEAERRARACTDHFPRPHRKA